MTRPTNISHKGSEGGAVRLHGHLARAPLESFGSCVLWVAAGVIRQPAELAYLHAVPKSH